MWLGGKAHAEVHSHAKGKTKTRKRQEEATYKELMTLIYKDPTSKCDISLRNLAKHTKGLPKKLGQ